LLPAQSPYLPPPPLAPAHQTSYQRTSRSDVPPLSLLLQNFHWPPFSHSFSTPNLRIEGPTNTIFEGPITSGPRNLTADVSDFGFTHLCNGDYNENVNPHPFNAALDAVDAASKSDCGFTYSLGYDGDLQDFYVLKIAGHGNGVAWGMLYNWKVVTEYGDGFTIAGCRQEVRTGDDVLYAYNTSETSVFLRVRPSTATVKKGGSVTFTITDGLTGAVQPGATIHGVKASKKGMVTVKYDTAGHFTFKAKETGAVRSELVKVTVTDWKGRALNWSKAPWIVLSLVWSFWDIVDIAG
jgi:hypothetical protein